MTRAQKDLMTSAWGALLQVHAMVVPALDRRLRDATGLPLSWYDVLLELAAAPDRRLTMSDLSHRVVLSRTRVSRLVDEMCRSGLVSRQGNPADARSAYAGLTEAGLTRYREAARVYLSGIEEEFSSHLTTQELESLATALQKVLSR